MKSRKRKKVFGMALALSLVFGQAAYGEIMVPPNPTSSLEQPDPSPQPGQPEQPDPSSQPAQPDPSSQPAQPDPSSQPGQSQTPVPADTGGNISPAQPGQDSGVSVSLQEPEIQAEGAVLLDGATGKVLYGKNQDQQFYPASITKVMTALLVLERCGLNDVVTFSASATTNLESGAVSLDITEGDQLTVEQCLYGLLLKSANEIGNGLAEHVAGSVEGFAGLMNAKAAQLGCQNTHFANPHGLNDSSHKTTPYDMALIMRAALQNETFRRIDTTYSYEFPATKKASARTITMGHKMINPSDSRYYEGIVGGKTGFTSLAGNTLVTGVERNGVQLIAVVMKASQTHYTDTKAMLDYGFANYEALTGGAAAQNPGDFAGGQERRGPGDGLGEQNLEGSSGGPGMQNGGGPGVRGWQKTADGAWRYYDPSTGQEVKSQWVLDGGAWYYLGEDGVMLADTVTPDGYRVDESGKWVQ